VLQYSIVWYSNVQSRGRCFHGFASAVLASYQPFGWRKIFVGQEKKFCIQYRKVRCSIAECRAEANFVLFASAVFGIILLNSVYSGRVQCSQVWWVSVEWGTEQRQMLLGLPLLFFGIINQ